MPVDNWTVMNACIDGIQQFDQINHLYGHCQPIPFFARLSFLQAW